MQTLGAHIVRNAISNEASMSNETVCLLLMQIPGGDVAGVVVEADEGSQVT
jgi:hypothetical protein